MARACGHNALSKFNKDNLATWHRDMAQLSIRADDMPAEMSVLLEEYPSDSWPEHAGFKDKTRQWLGAHRMFRRLSASVVHDTENNIDGNTDAGR